MSNPLVSIILPCYNAQNFILNAVNSVVNQSYSNLEILLIDDGSTDNSISLIKHIAEKDNRLQIVKNPVNLGLIKTLNKGIYLAKGQFIARMDADDISHKLRIEKQLNFLLKQPKIDIVGSAATPIDLIGNHLKNEAITYTETATLKCSVLITQPFFHGSILARAIVLKENTYSENFKHSEDFELWNRLSEKNVMFSNLKDSLYFYRINPNSVSRKFESIQIESHNLASKIYISKLLGKNIDINLIAILNNRPTKTVTKKHIIDVLQILNIVYLKFKSTNQSSELFEYVSRQKVDIFVQCLAKSNDIKIKFFCILRLLMAVRNRTNASYIFLKIKKHF